MSSFRSKSTRKCCQNQSKSIKFVTSCAGHVDGMKKRENCFQLEFLLILIFRCIKPSEKLRLRDHVYLRLLFDPLSL